MELYDEFSLLDAFNLACEHMAKSIEQGLIVDPQNPRELNVLIPDIDNWWGITIDGEDILTKYINKLLDFSPQKRESYIEHAKETLSEFPDYDRHFKAKISRTFDTGQAEALRYTPHIITYMDDVFEQLTGFKMLQNILEQNELKAKIYLSPTEEVSEEEKHLHGWGVYRFVLVPQETENLQPPKPQPRKLN